MYWYIPVAILVVLIAIGVPTWDHIIAYKERKEKEMEKKSVLDMMLDGWCDDCECDPAQCDINGKCLGVKSEEDKNGSEEKAV